MIEIHEELFQLLTNYHKENPDFKFRLRKTNRSNRLEEGYWFLGGNDYLAIGFWTGVDWRSKLPHIAFMVDENRHAWLHFTFSTRSEEMKFATNILLPELGVKVDRKKFMDDKGKMNLEFESRGDLKEFFQEFVEKYWQRIDSLVRLFQGKSIIGIIDDETFQNDLEKTNRFRDEISRSEEQLRRMSTSKLSGFEIENYRSIQSLSLMDIPLKSNWIFLTGENGTGKSNILKALARSIGFGKIGHEETQSIQDFRCKLFTTVGGKTEERFLRVANEQLRKRKQVFLGFAAYGPLRLNPIYGRLKKTQLEAARSQNGHSHTLFNNNAYLLDLVTQFEQWKEELDKRSMYYRRTTVADFLSELMLNIGKVEFGHDENGKSVIYYYEKDGEGKLFPLV